MTDRKISTRQFLKRGNITRLGLYLSNVGNIGFAATDGNDAASNRIPATDAWVDKDGYICIQIERRDEHNDR